MNCPGCPMAGELARCVGLDHRRFCHHVGAGRTRYAPNIRAISLARAGAPIPIELGHLVRGYLPPPDRQLPGPVAGGDDPAVRPPAAIGPRSAEDPDATTNPHLARLAAVRSCPFRGEPCRTCEGEKARCARYARDVVLRDCLKCVAGEPPRGER